MKAGAKPPSSPVLSALLPQRREQHLGQLEVDLGADLQRVQQAVGLARDDDELLEVEVVRRVAPAVDQVQERHRQTCALRCRWR